MNTADQSYGKDDVAPRDTRSSAVPVAAGARTDRGETAVARLTPNAIYGGIIGTVLASVTLAAIPPGQSPGYVAVWVITSVALAALTRSYGLFVSNHRVGAHATFWSDLYRQLLTGLPMLGACIPTLAMLALVHLCGWRDDVRLPDGSLTVGYTTVALMINTTLLFVWGVVAGRAGGYAWFSACIVGMGNTLLGVAVMSINVWIG